MIKSIINLLKPKTMAKTRSKICTISGKKFTANTTNFYVNHNAPDGLHPYHMMGCIHITRVSIISVEQLAPQ